MKRLREKYKSLEINGLEPDFLYFSDFVEFIEGMKYSTVHNTCAWHWILCMNLPGTTRATCFGHYLSLWRNKMQDNVVR